MKVRLWVGTGVVGSIVERTIEVESFDDDEFEMWVWEHIDSGYEILETADGN